MSSTFSYFSKIIFPGRFSAGETGPDTAGFAITRGQTLTNLQILLIKYIYNIRLDKARCEILREVAILAGNKDSGRVLAFKMSEKELKAAIEQYKLDAENGKFPRASWPHFCARLGYTEGEVAEVIQRGGEVVGAYSERAVLLQRMLTWIRGEMLSGAGWSGQNQTKAIFALKQNHGDGVAYADGNGKQSGPVEVKISFGGNDARAKKAGK